MLGNEFDKETLVKSNSSSNKVADSGSKEKMSSAESQSLAELQLSKHTDKAADQHSLDSVSYQRSIS